ncbi:hypothetical protein BDZ89DRAFT_1075742 [Hymenopellis radicata]|nr:hypothetical protein BDZ89DRAFT_1075742 [Hymenopellis radicata]
MFSSVFKYMALVAVIPSVLTQTLTNPYINTPASVVAGQPTVLTFGGTSRTLFSILPGGQVDAAPSKPVRSLAHQVLATCLTFIPDTVITFEIKDARGRLGYSATVTVRAGTSSSSTYVESSSYGSGTSRSTFLTYSYAFISSKLSHRHPLVF